MMYITLQHFLINKKIFYIIYTKSIFEIMNKDFKIKIIQLFYLLFRFSSVFLYIYYVRQGNVLKQNLQQSFKKTKNRKK